MINNLDDLKFLSSEVGMNDSYIQGAGGNISQKISDKKMAIKASGFLLKEIADNHGISIVDYKAVNAVLSNQEISEKNFSHALLTTHISGEKKPSIETGFHALLGKFVIHSHSVYVNTIGCAKEGFDFTKKNLKEVFWIDYATPGISITSKIKSFFHENIPAKGIIILQNHGVISWDDTADGALQQHEWVNKEIKKLVVFQPYNFLENALPPCSKFLFPDHAVFQNSNNKIRETLNAKKIAFSHKYILESIQQNQLTPNFLSNIEVDKLINMDSEKFRVKIAK